MSFEDYHPVWYKKYISGHGDPYPDPYPEKAMFKNGPLSFAYARDKKFAAGLRKHAARIRAGPVRTPWRAPLEKKFIDTTASITPFTVVWDPLAPTAGVVDCLSCPSVGDTESSRDGRCFRMWSIHVKIQISTPAIESSGAPLNDLSYRFLLVMDTQTNGTVIDGTDVMDAGSTSQEMSFRNLQNSARFRVLHDSGPIVIKRLNTNEGAPDLFAAPVSNRFFSINKTFGKEGIKVRCTGTAASVVAVSDNSISLIGVASSTAVEFEYETRLRFTSA